MKHYRVLLIVILIAVLSFMGYLIIPTSYQDCVHFPGSQINKVLGTCQTFYGAPFLEKTVTPPAPDNPLPSPVLENPSPTPTTTSCQPAGCSGQLCVDAAIAGDIVTTCEFKDEYTCYQQAACELQPNGECGWTPSPTLQSCLEQTGALPQATL